MKFSESPLTVENQQEALRFSFAEITEAFGNKDMSLRLNKITETLLPVEIVMDKNTRVSGRRRGGSITIGIAKNPKDIETAFRWGTFIKEEERVVKISHEISHRLQEVKGLEESLVNFLSGRNDIPESSHTYIELYTLLSGLGLVTGLAHLNTYHEQNELERQRVTVGASLDIRTLEDITEFLAAYSLGDEYFNFRLGSTKRVLNQEEQENISRLVVAVFHQYI